MICYCYITVVISNLFLHKFIHLLIKEIILLITMSKFLIIYFLSRFEITTFMWNFILYVYIYMYIYIYH